MSRRRTRDNAVGGIAMILFSIKFSVSVLTFSADIFQIFLIDVWPCSVEMRRDREFEDDGATMMMRRLRDRETSREEATKHQYRVINNVGSIS
jgi:hypothetical protein